MRHLNEQKLLEKAEAILHEYFTYSNFTGDQKRCILDIMSGKDVVALLPTGAGKSLCYQIPALYFEGLTLVVTPLISLMHDQVAQLTVDEREGEELHGLKKSIPAAYIDRTQENKTQILLDAAAARGKYKLLYVSPERLTDETFIRFAREKANIDFIAIDEAHCVSLWGYDFRPRYLDVVKFINGLRKRPVIGAYTATATQNVVKDIINDLKLDIGPAGPVCGGYRRDNLHFSVKKVGSEGEKRKFLLKYLQKNKNKTGIIYCSTKENVRDLYDYLREKNFYPVKYHAADEYLKIEEAEENQRRFCQDPCCKLIVATNAFGMGINKSDVRFVIHYNMPKDIESYYQEAGRAGRDREEAECILLFWEQAWYEEWDEKKGKYVKVHKKCDGKQYRCMKAYPDYEICESFVEKIKENEEFPKEIREDRYRLAKRRLKQMMIYCKKHECPSEKLQEYMVAYFESSTLGELLSEESIRNQQKFLTARADTITALYYNNTKIANEIRKGEYVIGETKTVDCGRSRKTQIKIEGKKIDRLPGKMLVSYRIDNEQGERITYFDMMIADAVYTLGMNGEKTIYPKRIYELLSGNPAVTLRPDKKADIEARLDKMIRTTIFIDKSKAAGKGKIYDDERNILYYSGKFLPLEKKGKRGYVLQGTSPLYQFATAFRIRGQFLTFPMNKLLIKTKDAPESKEEILPASEENVKIIYYLLFRIYTMSSDKRGPNSLYRTDRGCLSRVIRFDTLLEVTQIEMPKDKYSRQRKYVNLFGTAGYTECETEKGTEYNFFAGEIRGKIDVILNYYIRIGLIEDYTYQVDPYDTLCGKEAPSSGVKIQFRNPLDLLLFS